jgi:hypothetical protein
MRLCGESIEIRLMVGLVLAVGLAAACSEEGNGPPAAGPDAGPSFDASYDGPPPLETTPPDPIPADKRKDVVSAPVVFDWLRGGAWTANGDVGTITYADVDHQQVVQEVAVGTDIRSVALSPDGKWVAAVDRDGASVALIDAGTRTVRRTLSLGPTLAPPSGTPGTRAGSTCPWRTTTPSP